MSTHLTRRRFWLAAGGLALALLAAVIFTLGSLNLPVRPAGRSLAVLVALNTFIVAAFLVFGLVLSRSLLRLWAERRAQKLGARFRTRMVLGALAISLLPVVFLFLVSYALMNRTLNKWFPRPLEVASEQSRQLLLEQCRQEEETLQRLAHWSAQAATPLAAIHRALQAGADVAWSEREGQLEGLRWRDPSFGEQPRPGERLTPAGPRLWQAGSFDLLVAQVPMGRSTLFVAHRAPRGFRARWQTIATETAAYWDEQKALRLYKNQMLMTLLLFTLLLLFSSTWVALFLSKTVTVPIQALAEGTREISRGNLSHRVQVQAQDELGVLVRSFNRMAAQLDESRRQLEASKRNLEKALEEIEQRRRLLTTLLENLPTGVLLVDGSGHIVQRNPAVDRLFGCAAHPPATLAELVGDELAGKILWLAERARPQEAISQEFEVQAAGRQVHAAITAARLGLDGERAGFAVVIDDLSELLRAQRAAAWQEVAQRIAHEIRNPLTPIRLSAERLLRHAQRHAASAERSPLSAVAAECSRLILREVVTLKSLVDEFSRFARFPTARLAPTDLNAVVQDALELFQDRLDGVRVELKLAPDCPPIEADAVLLRRALANLIENALEAMAEAPQRILGIETQLDRSSAAVEIAVADTGHGISPADKEKLFLPYFSTRTRGTGLGLAIASRIVTEHHGTIRVEDHLPNGARFVIRLPVQARDRKTA